MQSSPARWRRVAPACAISAAFAAALLAPGAANAAVGTQCSGTAITGQGAAVQIVAEQTWTADFNTSSDKYACDGSQGTKAEPKVTYDGTSSGRGLKSWGAEGKLEGTPDGFGVGNAFIASAEAPNPTQISNIEKNESTPTEKTVETLPDAQFALTVYVNLPAGCTATSTSAPGRLVLSNAVLQGIYAGTITTWGGITGGGDTITGEGCSSDLITAVVRGEKAGTTNVLKKYLGLINTGELATASGNETWDALAEGKLNTVWPTGLKLIKTTEEGDAAEAKLVSSTPGSIGFSNLAELRVTGLFSPATAQKFWVEVQNGEKSKKPTFLDPSSNGDVAAIGSANCAKTTYTNGKVSFPPPAVTSNWNEVTTEIAKPEKTYSLCNFVYNVVVTSYSLLPETTLEEATSVNNFFEFVSDKKGGQAELQGNDYYGVPKGAVEKDLVNGAKAIGF